MEKTIKIKTEVDGWLKEHDAGLKTMTQLRTMNSVLREVTCVRHDILRRKDRARFGFNLADLLPNVLEMYYQDRLKEEQKNMVSLTDKYRKVRSDFLSSEELRQKYSETICRLENRSFLERVFNTNF